MLQFVGIVVALGYAQSIISTLGYLLFTTTQEQYNVEIITSVVLLVFFALLTIYAPKVVTTMRMNRGFDTDFINLGELTPQSVLQIAIIVLSLGTIISVLPSAITSLIQRFTNTINQRFYFTDTHFQLTLNGIKLLFAYLALIYSNKLASMFVSNKK